MKNTNITLESLEPFAYGYLNADRDDVEYRIACGMKNRARFMPIVLDKTSTFAGSFDRDEVVGARYIYGDGISINGWAFEERKKAHPELAGELDALYEKIAPLSTGRLFELSKSDEERVLGERSVMWGGGWGGHANPDYYMLLHLGTHGLRVRNELYRAMNPGRDDFYDALNLALDALEIIGERASAIASELALECEAEGDLNGKARMERIVAAFENIPVNPPRDFFEAVQFFWIASNFDGVDSPGRFDWTMGDYYPLSEDRYELLEELWQLFYETRTWNLCIGGSDENFNDFSNALTYDILEIARKYKYNTPNLTMRVHRNTPDALWKSAVETIATGIGMPALYNDEVVCPALEALGIPAHDAHEYCMNGCNQIDIFGKSHMGLEDGEVSLAKCLELTLHNGYCPKFERELGLKLGEPESFGSFDELMAAYKRQVEYVTDFAVTVSNKSQQNYAKNAPNPYRSNLIRGCVEKALDYKCGGPLYGHGQILAEGIADTVDSLAAIKHFVYDTKKYTLAELTSALKVDFDGYDELYNDFAHYTKFGNDDAEVDAIAAEVVDHFNDYLLTKKTFRGGIFGGGCSPFNRAANYGAQLGAMPNGKRRDSTMFADSIGSVPGSDVNGPTALINSVLSFDHVKAKSGFVLNLKFVKSIFETEAGMSAFESLAKAYFAGGGQQLSVAVVSAQELRDAQAHPERHANLIVRVGGFSEYFNKLSPGLQENVIARSELCCR